MEYIIGQLTTFSLLSVFVRLFLSVLFGAFIGIDRVRKRRPAGIKTHSLVCMGAALIMITSEFLSMRYGINDISRMGAQVISGVGFLGAGTIMVTGRNQIKGLTTAAGLWFSACLGLAIGAGFYEGAFIAAFFVLLVIKVLNRVDYYFHEHSKIMDIYLEFNRNTNLLIIINAIKAIGCDVVHTEIGKGSTYYEDKQSQFLLMSIHTPKGVSHQSVVDSLSMMDGILSLEEV